MSICQRKDGRFVVKFKDEAGRWRQKGFRDRGAAEAFEGENLYDENENKRLTVAESIVLFLKNTRHCQQEKESYALILRRMGDMLATKYVDSLDRRDLENFRLILKEEYGVAAPGINRAVKKLKAAFRWCASEDMLSTVPWAKYRPLPEPPHRHHCGDFAGFMKVYSRCNPALQWLIRTCLALCLRPGKEVSGLRWGDVDLPHGKAHIWMPKVSRWKDVIAPGWWVDEARIRSEGKAPEDYVCLTLRGRPWHASFTTWYDLQACRHETYASLHCQAYGRLSYAGGRGGPSGRSCSARARFRRHNGELLYPRRSWVPGTGRGEKPGPPSLIWCGMVQAKHISV